MRNFVLLLGLIVILVVGGFLYFQANPPGSSSSQTSTTAPNNKEQLQVAVVAQNLDTPWGLAFLPEGGILVTERPGRVRFISSQGVLQQSPSLTLSNVTEVGEGGLLGIDLHPNFSQNSLVYLYYTYKDGSNEYNKVSRFKYSAVELAVACPENDPNCNKARTVRLGEEQTIIDRIPSSSNHNGGRIKFGPDGYLYITTGDAQNPPQAQDINSLGGKILRVTDEGQPALDNPFGNLVYSYGHRNPQGLAWDDQGVLWEIEHGSSARDEFNRIEKGKNYGWPQVSGDQQQAGMEQPFFHSGDDTWAPAGAAYYRYSDDKYSIFFTGLRGQALYEMEFNQGNSLLRTHFKGEYGRLREVVLGPDNMLYITTSNQDGRGNSKAGDDKILKINPQKL